MHGLVQGQHKEALPVGSELSLPSLGRRESGLVEVGLAQLGLEYLSAKDDPRNNNS
jgi:hypothetical protein